jgi:hypothetical protein
VGDLSGWVEWVPAAAIVGAAAAYIVREFEAWRSRRRELKGLLRLLSVEIEYNEHLLRVFEEYPRAIGEVAAGAGLLTRAWEENRERIAQLIKHSEDLQYLADYFMNVDVFEKGRLVQQGLEEDYAEHIPVLREQGRDAQQVVNKVVRATVEPRVEGPALAAPRDDS